MYETKDKVIDHDTKTRKGGERQDEVETFIAFECFSSMIKHMERVSHMTSQTDGQT